MEILAETLFRYFSQHGRESNISVIDTDNLKNNGQILRAIQLEYAKEKGDSSYLSWFENNVDFLEEIGDRVVPNSRAVPEAIKKEARKRIGKEDRLATYTEKMPQQWSLVLGDPKRRLRVPFSELASRGVVVTRGNIDSCHNWKLRLVNSVHVPFITHLAQLSGYKKINQAANDPVIKLYLEAVVQGNARIVEKDIPIEGEDAAKYALSFVERISILEDDVARVNINHTLKLRERIAPTIISKHYTAASERFKDKLAFALAAVFRYLTPLSELTPSPFPLPYGERIEVRGKRKSLYYQDKDTYRGKDDLGRAYSFTDPDPTIPELLMESEEKDKEYIKKKIREIFEDFSLWTLSLIHI